jgi:hypothetical protein
LDLASAFAVTLIADPIVALLWAIPIAFVLLIPSLRLWWIHAPLALVLAAGVVIHHPDRALAFDAFAIGVAVFPILCRQIPSDALVLRYGVLWFALFALMAAMIEAGSVSQQSEPIEPTTPIHHDTIFAGGKPDETPTRAG